MKNDPNVIRRLFRDYWGLSVGGVVTLFLGQLIVNGVLGWVGKMLWEGIIWTFSNLHINAVQVVGWVLTAAGIGAIGFAIAKAQRDINRDITAWKKKTQNKGLWVSYLYHLYVDKGKDKIYAP